MQVCNYSLPVFIFVGAIIVFVQLLLGSRLVSHAASFFGVLLFLLGNPVLQGGVKESPESL